MASIDLCTLADVKALMQKKSSDQQQDSLIGTLITRASAKIMRDYGREFVPGGPDSESFTAATRTFEHSWSGWPVEAFVDLRPYDLRVSVTPTVVVDSDQASPITLTTDEYRLWPRPAKNGVSMAIRVQSFNVSPGAGIGWRNRQIQVTGTWGFPSIPVEVTQAAAEVVMHWVTAYPAVERPGSLDEGATVAAPRGYPMAALDMLRSFERATNC